MEPRFFLDSGRFVRALAYNVGEEREMRIMIGKVASVEGQVEVIDTRGEHRLLVAGDLLREG